jgi:glycosyltransferase involved in cell wall biosynthesis
MRVDTSVIIAVHNGRTYVTEAMTSVLRQFNESDELIVVDDASNDDTLTVVSAVVDKRLRVVTSPKRGVSAARNAGLAAARGNFAAFLDHDDYWPAGRHKAMLRMLSENPILDAVFGRVRVEFAPGVLPSPKYLALDGQFLHGVSVCGGLYRRRILDKVDGFAEDMRFGEDVDYNLRLLNAGMQIGLCEADALVYRRHDSNMTNDRQGFRQGFVDILRRKLERERRDLTSRDMDDSH